MPNEDQARREIEHVLQELPGMRSPFLATQATCIGVVDRYLEDMEVQLLRDYMADERTPPWTILAVALSQMWVFSVYELLRTWRQMASEVSRYSQDLAKLKGPKREERIARERERIKRVQSHVSIPDRNYDACFEAVEEDAEFGKRVSAALQSTEEVFRAVETLRVTMAKHEVPKTKGLRAQGAGYGRIDLSSGSIHWLIVLKDGSSTIISRQSIAEAIRAIADIDADLGDARGRAASPDAANQAGTPDPYGDPKSEV